MSAAVAPGAGTMGKYYASKIGELREVSAETFVFHEFGSCLAHPQQKGL
jgi:hypothetical protein